MGLKIKVLLITLLLAFSTDSFAKTRVFVYNNTLAKVDLNLRQTGTSLGASYWTQGVRSIPATEAHEILSIKKNGGVSNNTTYGFKFDLSDGSNTVALKIRIEGRAVGRRTYQAVANGQFFDDSSLKTVRWGQRTISYRKENNGNFIFVIADPSKKLFRFPVQDRSLIDEANNVSKPLAGPFTLDMRTGDRNRGSGLSCMAFNGKKNPPHCYGGHEGTDYMLKGGFKQMDREGNYVVAARSGTVVKVVQNLYDRCKAKLYSNDAESLLQPDCNGNNPNMSGNHIVVDHGNELFTMYYHVKKNSSLVSEGDTVKCGEPLARIGSSGYSTKPHLHFEVLQCKDSEQCGQYNSAGIVSTNPYKGVYTGRGFWTNQGSGRLPSDQCAAGQAVYSGPIAPPARGCSSDAECGQGNYCNKRLGENRCLAEGSLDVGAACYKNRECDSGKCQGAGDARMCVCNTDGDCASGQYCNKRVGQNQCLADATKLIGQRCDKNKECASGKCQGTGSARMCVCNANSDCASGQYCNNRLGQNRCLADGNKSIGQSCSKNNECNTNKCEKNMCVCSKNSDCAGGQKCKTPVLAKNYCK